MSSSQEMSRRFALLSGRGDSYTPISVQGRHYQGKGSGAGASSKNSKRQSGSRSTGEQAGEILKALPEGIVGLLGDVGRTIAAPARMSYDIVRELADRVDGEDNYQMSGPGRSGDGFLKDAYRSLAHEMPFLTDTAESMIRTAYRSPDWVAAGASAVPDWLGADGVADDMREGYKRFVGSDSLDDLLENPVAYGLEDVGNVAIFTGGAGRALGAGANAAKVTRAATIAKEVSETSAKAKQATRTAAELEQQAAARASKQAAAAGAARAEAAQIRQTLGSHLDDVDVPKLQRELRDELTKADMLEQAARATADPLRARKLLDDANASKQWASAIDDTLQPLQRLRQAETRADALSSQAARTRQAANAERNLLQKEAAELTRQVDELATARQALLKESADYMGTTRGKIGDALYSVAKGANKYDPFEVSIRAAGRGASKLKGRIGERGAEIATGSVRRQASQEFRRDASTARERAEIGLGRDLRGAQELIADVSPEVQRAGVFAATQRDAMSKLPEYQRALAEGDKTRMQELIDTQYGVRRQLDELDPDGTPVDGAEARGGDIALTADDVFLAERALAGQAPDAFDGMTRTREFLEQVDNPESRRYVDEAGNRGLSPTDQALTRQSRREDVVGAGRRRGMLDEIEAASGQKWDDTLREALDDIVEGRNIDDAFKVLEQDVKVLAPRFKDGAAGVIRQIRRSLDEIEAVDPNNPAAREMVAETVAAYRDLLTDNDAMFVHGGAAGRGVKRGTRGRDAVGEVAVSSEKVKAAGWTPTRIEEVLANTLVSRQQLAANAAYRRFVDTVGQEAGPGKPRPDGDWVLVDKRSPTMQRKMSDPGEKVWLPRESYRALELHGNEFTGTVGSFERVWAKGGYDRAMRGWKIATLPFSVTWHTGNMVGNAMISYLSGSAPGTAALRRAFKDLNDLRNGKSLGPEIDRMLDSGKASDLMRDAKITLGGKRDSLFGRAVERSYAFNNAVDNLGRLANMRQSQLAGASLDEAIRRTNRVFGQFGSMTPGEARVIKRIFPFYEWQRTITKDILRLPIEHPARMAWTASLAERYLDGETRWAMLPSYYQGAGVLTEDGRFIRTANYLPYETDSIFNPLGGVSPLIKAGSRFITGQSLDGQFDTMLPPGHDDSIGNRVRVLGEDLKSSTRLGRNVFNPYGEKRYSTGAPKLSGGRRQYREKAIDWMPYAVEDTLRGNLGLAPVLGVKLDPQRRRKELEFAKRDNTRRRAYEQQLRRAN